MKKFFIIFICIFILFISAILIFLLNHSSIIPCINKVYYAEDFGIISLQSEIDCDNDGIDDYTDIMLGARKDAENRPTYKSAYYSGGYPPNTEGVCTDVVWRAFKNAGYNLKDLIDEDIKNNVNEYPRVQGKPDPNIDFRRVPNLISFFSRNAISLSTDLSQIADWQPGDIVTFEKNHVGIISDKRNKNGIPYLIHNGGQKNREEDILEIYTLCSEISGHFRWNTN
jgi:uncharacterized protein YijF (DUF1287 family)